MVYRLRTCSGMPPVPAHPSRPREPQPVVLILSEDAVAAALLGGLVETLGFSVRFAQPPETWSASLRRVRPRICLVDCADPASDSDEFLGHAAMRGVSVVIFGTREVLDRLHALALAHRIETLLLPPRIDEMEA